MNEHLIGIVCTVSLVALVVIVAIFSRKVSNTNRKDALENIRLILDSFDEPDGCNAVRGYDDICELIEKHKFAYEYIIREGLTLGLIYEKACRAQLAQIELYEAELKRLAVKIADSSFREVPGHTPIVAQKMSYAIELIHYTEPFVICFQTVSSLKRGYEKLSYCPPDK